MKRWLLISLIGLSMLLTGCTGSASTAEKKLAENEQAFTWWADRTKEFGSYDYQVTEEEAFKDLEERFEVSLLPSFEKAQKIIDTAFLKNGRSAKPRDYFFYASNKGLIVTNILRFKGEDQGTTSYGKIVETYDYLPELKKVKVASQRIELHNETVNNQYNGNDLMTTLTELGTLLEIDDFSKYLDTFKETVKEPEALGNKDIVIYENYKAGKKAGTFGKLLGVKYAETGVVSQIYAVTYDYRR